jgi:hypothetical protein
MESDRGKCTRSAGRLHPGSTHPHAGCRPNQLPQMQHAGGRKATPHAERRAGCLRQRFPNVIGGRGEVPGEQALNRKSKRFPHSPAIEAASKHQPITPWTHRRCGGAPLVLGQRRSDSQITVRGRAGGTQSCHA